MIRLIALSAAVCSILAQYAIWFYAPIERTMGVVQKIFYTHLPMAWCRCQLLRGVRGLDPLTWRGAGEKDARLAGAAAELGVLFPAGLVQGMCWEGPSGTSGGPGIRG